MSFPMNKPALNSQPRARAASTVKHPTKETCPRCGSWTTRRGLIGVGPRDQMHYCQNDWHETTKAKEQTP